MNNLTPIAFIVPTIALILVVIFYFILSKKTVNKTAFKKFTFIVVVLSFLLNFAWEVIQMPLYEGTSFNVQSVALCALASVADAIMVLLLYYFFAFIYKEPLWIQKLLATRVFALVVTGLTGAILVEIRHVSSGSWSYAKSMPLIPFVDVGFSSVLQFMLLPVCIYYLSFKTIK